MRIGRRSHRSSLSSSSPPLSRNISTAIFTEFSSMSSHQSLLGRRAGEARGGGAEDAGDKSRPALGSSWLKTPTGDSSYMHSILAPSSISLSLWRPLIISPALFLQLFPPLQREHLPWTSRRWPGRSWRTPPWVRPLPQVPE